MGSKIIICDKNTRTLSEPFLNTQVGVLWHYKHEKRNLFTNRSNALLPWDLKPLRSPITGVYRQDVVSSSREFEIIPKTVVTFICFLFCIFYNSKFGSDYFDCFYLNNYLLSERRLYLFTCYLK